MTVFIAPPIEPSAAAEFSDTELERELTLATLTAAREPTFNILLTERRRRRRGNRTDIFGKPDSFSSTEGRRSGD